MTRVVLAATDPHGGRLGRSPQRGYASVMYSLRLDSTATSIAFASDVAALLERLRGVRCRMCGETKYGVGATILHERVQCRGKRITDRAENGVVRHDILEELARRVEVGGLEYGHVSEL